MTFGPAPVPRSEVGNPCYKACMQIPTKKKKHSHQKKGNVCVFVTKSNHSDS